AVADRPTRNFTSTILRTQVVLEIGRNRAQLAQRTRLELADALARDAETGTDLFECLRGLAVETEPQREDAAQARVESQQRSRQLLAAELVRRRVVGTIGIDVLD